MAEPSHFEGWSRGLVTVVRPRARDLFWLRGFEDYWPDDRSRRFSDELTGLADAAPGPFVFDLSRIPGLNRDGFALVLRLHKRLADRGNVLAISASPDLLEVLEITRLNTLFYCTPQLDAAVEAFGMGPESGDGAGSVEREEDRTDDLTDTA